MLGVLPGRSPWPPRTSRGTSSPTCATCSRVPVHGQRLPGRHRSSPCWPRSVGWFMVLRRQTFAGHTLALVGFPGAAAGAGWSAQPTLGYFAVLPARARWSSPRSPAARPAATTASEPAVIGTRAGRSALASGYLFVSPVPRHPRGHERPAVRQLPRHHRRARSLALARGGRGVRWPPLATIGRPLCSPRSTPTSRSPVASRWPRSSVGFLLLLGAAAAERQPDHRLAAGVRAARPAAGHRPPVSPPDPGWASCWRWRSASP